MIKKKKFFLFTFDKKAPVTGLFLFMLPCIYLSREG